MFRKYKELREFLAGHGRLISRLESNLYQKIAKEDVVECDDCGCLLNKDKRFKQPSTVVAVEAPQRYVGSSGWVPSSDGATERIMEHYKCFRCQPKEVPIQEGSA